MSRQVNIRMPEELVEALGEITSASGLSLSEYVIRTLSSAVKIDRPEKPPARLIRPQRKPKEPGERVLRLKAFSRVSEFRHLPPFFDPRLFFWRHLPEEIIVEECWLWKGPSDKQGRALTNIRVGVNRLPAARLSWVIHNGEIPEGYWVCHTADCENYLTCVNPAHLELHDPKEGKRT